MSVVSLKSPIKELREKQRLPLADAARGLGVSIPELAQWEKSLDGLSDAALRDLAIFYGVNVPDLTGKNPPEGKVHDWPFALEEVPKEAPYGTLAIGFPWGTRSYPVDNGVRERLLDAIAHFDPQAEDPPTSWIHTWTLDNRMLYINLDHVDWIDLVGDDEEAMPPFAHPEVYFALETFDIEEREDGPVLKQALANWIEQFESEEDAIRSVRHSLAITAEGKERWYQVLELADTMAPFILSLSHDLQVARNGLLIMSSEGYYSARHINLSRTAVIEFPAEQYARLSRDE